MYNHSNTLAKPVVHLYTWCKSTESKKINRPKVLGSRGTRAREWFKAWGEKGGTSVWDEEKRGGNSSIVVGRRRNKREEEERRARGGGVGVGGRRGKGNAPFYTAYVWRAYVWEYHHRKLEATAWPCSGRSVSTLASTSPVQHSITYRVSREFGGEGEERIEMQKEGYNSRRN